MSEYIKREDATDAFSQMYPSATKSFILEKLSSIPAADVEPVVRCPKCVNGQRVNNVWTRCAKDGTMRLDSFFCAHGKERER